VRIREVRPSGEVGSAAYAITRRWKAFHCVRRILIKLLEPSEIPHVKYVNTSFFGLCISGWRQPRRMGAAKGAPVKPPSTINSTALMYDESSEARKSTAFASFSGSPHRPSGTVEEKKSESLVTTKDQPASQSGTATELLAPHS
jgi:hypothetical protein